MTSNNSVESKQVECLSEALYFEGRSESEKGQRAIAEVILNRVAYKSYPSTICTVVRQAKFYPSGGIDLHSCQFSYYCDGRADIPKYGPTWSDSIMVSEFVIMEREFASPLDSVEGATHYHASYVHPRWADHMQNVVQIQDHVFYK